MSPIVRAAVLLPVALDRVQDAVGAEERQSRGAAKITSGERNETTHWQIWNDMKMTWTMVAIISRLKIS